MRRSKLSHEEEQGFATTGWGHTVTGVCQYLALYV
jgi:hypothetical protein